MPQFRCTTLDASKSGPNLDANSDAEVKMPTFRCKFRYNISDTRNNTQIRIPQFKRKRSDATIQMHKCRCKFKCKFRCKIAKFTYETSDTKIQMQKLRCNSSDAHIQMQIQMQQLKRNNSDTNSNTKTQIPKIRYQSSDTKIQMQPFSCKAIRCKFRCNSSDANV